MSEMIKLPDGSLVMVGASKPSWAGTIARFSDLDPRTGRLRQQQQESILERLKAGLAKALPSRLNAQPDPWWIPKAATNDAPAAPTNAAPLMGSRDPWGEIARESAHEEAVANQLGDFSKRVMNSPQLIEGRWFR